MIHISIHETSLDPFHILTQFQQQAAFNASQSGANALFIGTMRDFNEGDDLIGMRLEHYPAMTQKQLEQIAQQAQTQWRLNHILIAHRVGDIQPADSIVLVATWSAHRNAAFESCRHIMEALKHEAPFWKHEMLKNGKQRWVEKNTTG